MTQDLGRPVSSLGGKPSRMATIIYAAKLLSDPPSPVKPSQALAILEICAILIANVISLVTGILALVFYNEPEVQKYFAGLSAQDASAPEV